MSAIDIVAVRQPDGTIKCTSFQVLFSSKKPSEMVQVEVNGQLISSCTMVAHQSGQVCFSPEVPTRKPHKIVHNEKTKQLSLVTLEDVADEGSFELKDLSGIQKQGSVTLDEPKPKCVNNVQNNPKRVKKSGSLGSLLSAMKSEKKKTNTGMSSSTPNAIRKNLSSVDIKEDNSIVLSKVPTNAQLNQMNLKDGINEVRYRTVVTNQVATARLYLWNPETKIVISDVDGTITKSDKRGLFYYKLGYDWTHDSVVSLYNNLVSHGYQIVYVTARSVKTAVTTRAFLDKITAPHGPIFTAPHNYLGCVATELWKLTDQVKLAHLSALRALFPRDENPFVAGFGNATHDAKCYREIQIDPSRIYIINRSSEVNVNNSKTKYCELMASIHTLFPPVSPVPQIQDVLDDDQPPLIQID